MERVNFNFFIFKIKQKNKFEFWIKKQKLKLYVRVNNLSIDWRRWLMRPIINNYTTTKSIHHYKKWGNIWDPRIITVNCNAVIVPKIMIMVLYVDIYCIILTEQVSMKGAHMHTQNRP